MKKIFTNNLAKARIAANRLIRSKELTLSEGFMSELPSEIKDCHWIEVLSLHNNKDLRDLSNLKYLKKLKRIYFYKTGVMDLSPLSNLKNLEVLVFWNTRVSDLSPLKELHNLYRVEFHNCPVKDLTPIIHVYKRWMYDSEPWRYVRCFSDSLISPPDEIIKKGFQSVVNYSLAFEKKYSSFSLKEKIQSLILRGLVKEAIYLLPSNILGSIDLMTTFINLTNQYNEGRIDYEAYCQKQNIIIDAALDIVNNFDKRQNKKLVNQTISPTIVTKQVFIVYSKPDREYLGNFKTHLSALIRQDLLTVYDDTCIQPGQDWNATIRNELKNSDIIILLVSANLIASDYFWNVEMKEAMELHEKGEATVIPVIISSCNWEKAPFGKLNILPEKGNPIERWTNSDEAWAQVVKRIEELF